LKIVKGFTFQGDNAVPIEEAFFTDLLPEMDDPDEIRAVLFAFWYLNSLGEEPRYIRLANLLKDDRLAGSFGSSYQEQEERLMAALLKACERVILLAANQYTDLYYFLNSERGQAARDGLQAGSWQPGEDDHPPLVLQPQRPNIYTLYEQNIGPLTPILAETLQDAEQTYPEEWIEDAIKIAVIKNVRTWRYVEAILKSWKEKGRDGTDRKTAEENRKRDSEGKYADFINR
jgi:DnaD/phage-associated family protein